LAAKYFIAILKTIKGKVTRDSFTAAAKAMSTPVNNPMVATPWIFGPGDTHQANKSAWPVEIKKNTSEWTSLGPWLKGDSIGWVEAEGDYARLHSASGSHLVRIPLSALETRWRNHGFQRVHRSSLVPLRVVTGLRTTDGAMLVRLRANGASPAVELPVSRRQARELRDRLVRNPMRNLRPAGGVDD
jgi:hypothetical protein